MWNYKAGYYAEDGKEIVVYDDICCTEDGAIYAAGCAELQLASDGHWGNHWSDWRRCND
jgi:hypothetical protein